MDAAVSDLLDPARTGPTGEIETHGGGLDADWTDAKGLPAVSLGRGQHRARSVAEYGSIDALLVARRAIEHRALD